MRKSQRIAFVVWLDPPLEGDAELCGKVEHVATAVRERFDSGEELVRLLERLVRRPSPPQPSTGQPEPN